MSGDSQLAVQEAVATQLLATSAVTALVGQRIFDEVPTDTTDFPYIVIGLGSSQDFSVKGNEGLDQTIELYIWDAQYGGVGRTKRVMAAIRTALNDQSFSVSGHNLVMSRFIGSDVRMQSDGVTREAVARYRIMTEEA